jgi:outer membrane protein W
VSLRIIKKVAVLIILSGISNSTLAASAGTGGVGAAFSKNSTNFSVVIGSGSAFDDDYTILGLGVGYYVTNGLELGIELQRWISGEPTITKVSPQIRYVFTEPKTIKPYVGAFYRRTSYDDYNGIELDDQDSFGYRAGAYFSTNNRVYIGAGVVYEEFKNCSRFTDCSTTSPEILFTVSF